MQDGPKKTYSFRLSDKAALEIKEAAKAAGCSQGEYVESLIEQNKQLLAAQPLPTP